MRVDDYRKNKMPVMSFEFIRFIIEIIIGSGVLGYLIRRGRGFIVARRDLPAQKQRVSESTRKLLKGIGEHYAQRGLTYSGMRSTHEAVWSEKRDAAIEKLDHLARWGYDTEAENYVHLFEKEVMSESRWLTQLSLDMKSSCALRDIADYLLRNSSDLVQR